MITAAGRIILIGRCSIPNSPLRVFSIAAKNADIIKPITKENIRSVVNDVHQLMADKIEKLNQEVAK